MSSAPRPPEPAASEPATSEPAAVRSSDPLLPTADVDQLTVLSAGTLVERMGIAFTEVSAERLVATMPVEGNTQPYGLLHGGASVVLAETLGSVGSARHAGPGRVAVGIEVNASHHRAVRTGSVTGTARALHLGATTASWQVEVLDEAGRLVCSARITCLLRASAPGG